MDTNNWLGWRDDDAALHTPRELAVDSGARRELESALPFGWRVIYVRRGDAGSFAVSRVLSRFQAYVAGIWSTIFTVAVHEAGIDGFALQLGDRAQMHGIIAPLERLYDALVCEGPEGERPAADVLRQALFGTRYGSTMVMRPLCQFDDSVHDDDDDEDGPMARLNHMLGGNLIDSVRAAHSSNSPAPPLLLFSDWLDHVSALHSVLSSGRAAMQRTRKESGGDACARIEHAVSAMLNFEELRDEYGYQAPLLDVFRRANVLWAAHAALQCACSFLRELPTHGVAALSRAEIEQLRNRAARTALSRMLPRNQAITSDDDFMLLGERLLNTMLLLDDCAQARTLLEELRARRADWISCVHFMCTAAIAHVHRDLIVTMGAYLGDDPFSRTLRLSSYQQTSSSIFFANRLHRVSWYTLLSKLLLPPLDTTAHVSAASLRRLLEITRVIVAPDGKGLLVPLTDELYEAVRTGSLTTDALLAFVDKVQREQRALPGMPLESFTQQCVMNAYNASREREDSLRGALRQWPSKLLEFGYANPNFVRAIESNQPPAERCRAVLPDAWWENLSQSDVDDDGALPDARGFDFDDLLR